LVGRLAFVPRHRLVRLHVEDELRRSALRPPPGDRRIGKVVVRRVDLDRVEALRVVGEASLRRGAAAWTPGLHEPLVGEAARAEPDSRRHGGNIEALRSGQVGYKPRAMEGVTTEVVVTGPDATPIASLPLVGERVTVGRLPELNDIALQPDPALYVSRAAHCAFERDGERWALVDGGSVNGTYLRRGGKLERGERSSGPPDGDGVCLLPS